MALQISLTYRVIIKIIYTVGAVLGIILFKYNSTKNRVTTSTCLLIYHYILFIVLSIYGIQLTINFVMTIKVSTVSFSMICHVFKNNLLLMFFINALLRIGRNREVFNETINEIMDIIQWINKTNVNSMEMRKFWKLLMKICVVDNCLITLIYITYFSIVRFNILNLLPDLYVFLLELIMKFVINSLLTSVVALEYIIHELNKMIKTTTGSFIIGHPWEARQLISNDELNTKLQSFSLVYSKISNCSKKITNLFPSLSVVFLLFCMLNLLLVIFNITTRSQEMFKNIKFLLFSISFFMQDFCNLFYLIYICIGVGREVSLKC